MFRDGLHSQVNTKMTKVRHDLFRSSLKGIYPVKMTPSSTCWVSISFVPSVRDQLITSIASWYRSMHLRWTAIASGTVASCDGPRLSQATSDRLVLPRAHWAIEVRDTILCGCVVEGANIRCSRLQLFTCLPVFKIIDYLGGHSALRGGSLP